MRTARLIALAVLLPVGAARAQADAPVSVSLDHVAIYVRDVDKSAAFYTSVFGLKPVPAPVPRARWLLTANGTMLHIVPGRTTPLGHSRWDHIALACPDMDTMIATLKARGIAWTDMEGHDRPQIRGDGVKQIFVADPDGYWIEINDASKRR